MVWTSGVEFKVEVTSGQHSDEDTHFISYSSSGGAKKEGPAEVFHLSPVFPNPASSTSTVQFTTPEVTDVQMVIVDIVGREVHSSARFSIPPGTHSFPIDSSSLPSGIYLLRVEAGSFAGSTNFVKVQ